MASSETTPLLRQVSATPITPDADVGPEAQNADEAHEPRGTFARRLTTLNGFALLISIVIGSGVFSSPGPVDANVPSPGAALLVWLVGGVLAWTGALTMAELGTAIPGEGGIQPYLTHSYGEWVGYLAAWSWIVATMPATLAILSIVFVETIYSSLGVHEPEPPIAHKLFSLLVLVVVATANSISTKTSTRLGNFFVAVKLLAIFLLIVAGLTVVFIYAGSHGKRDMGGGDWHTKGWFEARDTAGVDWKGVGLWESLGFYSTALYGALWAYSGWDKANYVAAELVHPKTQLPLAVNTAIPTIIVCYVAANAVYYVLLPWNVVSTTDAAAVTAVTYFLGKTVAYFASALICLVIAGSALGNSFVAGRMTVAAANKAWIPNIFGTVGQVGPFKVSKSDTRNEDEDADEAMDGGESPINALILSTLLSALYILFGNMRILLTLNGLAEYAFFFLTVLGAIILRWREPELHRPVKPFILIPILFAIISGFVVVRGAMFALVQAGILVAIWGIGVLYYLVRKRVLQRR
ncbi:solute carrier family 7 protein [Massariosphaeria phaeospora]|uniref:Solute carrier family 7 protein n=1 Tax=Massariosphaeria phaeospora TaxID=100035 RepID=A0A7C8M2N2_9PLEO|nr:solute carrier family 7 protein [Massariosphaeria phaeospora]